MPKSRIMVLTEQTEKICLLSGNQTKSQAYYRKGEFGLRNWGFNSFVCKRTSENTNPLQLSVWQLKWESFGSLAHNNRRWKGLATDLRGGDLKKKKTLANERYVHHIQVSFRFPRRKKVPDTHSPSWNAHRFHLWFLTSFSLDQLDTLSAIMKHKDN